MPLDEIQLGRYHLIRLIGGGGMGEVYLAEDTLIQRQVAIKVIRSEGFSDPDADSTRNANRLFLREAMAIARLNHPHILPLFDYGENTVHGSAITYMVMPYCPEGSLAAWLKQWGSNNPLSLQDVVQLISQAASALQYAHNQQLVHQDVKPPNFLIRGWTESNLPDLLLTDFGVAKFLATTSGTSQSIRGTPTYMAPEQWEGHPVPASDQYALAIMTYQLLTGELPFQGGPSQMMYQHLTTQPKPPSTHIPSISPDIDLIIMQALAKKPEHRFASISAFARAFQQAVQSSTDVSTAPTVVNTRQNTGVSEDRTVIAGSAQDTPNAAHAGINAIPSSLPPQNRAAIDSPSPFNPGVATVRESATAVPPYHRPAGKEDRRSSTGRGILTFALIILILAASVGAFYYIVRPHLGFTPDVSATATAQANATVGAQANETATASAQANATATAQALASRNPYPPNTGTLALDDPLRDNSKGSGWEEGLRDGGYCTFTGGVYQSNIPQDGVFHSCLALNVDFTNFAFEVQATITSGDYSGIVFRANRATTQFYYFLISRSGNYYLKVIFDKSGDSSVIAGGSSAAIHTNLGEMNLLAVVAQASNIDLYVNHQLLQSVSDSTYSHGQIGVVTLAGEANFSNARVWKV